VVVVATVVVGAVVVVARVVVVGLGAVVGGAVVAGRVLGGAVAAEVRGADGGGAGAARVEVVVVLGSRTVVRGVSRLPDPTAATAATVVVAGHGRPPQAPDGAGSPNAWSVSTTTVAAVATPVASHGRRSSRASPTLWTTRATSVQDRLPSRFGGPGNRA